MEDTSDSALIALARSGDKRAFGQLVERYQWLVKRIAMGMVSNAEIARELAQEAILQAYLSLDQLRDNARFKLALRHHAQCLSQLHARAENGLRIARSPVRRRMARCAWIAG